MLIGPMGWRQATEPWGVPRPMTDADLEAAGQDEEALLADLSRHIEEDLCFFADAYRVARLVLLALRGVVWPEERLPELERRREPPGWRREVAALIVAVVHAHLPEERQRRTVRKASVGRKRRRKIK